MTAPPRTRPSPLPVPHPPAGHPLTGAPDLPVQRSRPVLRRLVEVLPPPAVDAVAVPPPAPHRGDPAAARSADRVLRVAVEVVAGHRPAGQLEAVLAPSVRSRLRWLRRSAGHLRARVLSVRCQQCVPGVLEAVAVVATTAGVRALVARFEQVVDDGGSRWMCTVLDLKLTPRDYATQRGADGRPGRGIDPRRRAR